MFLKFPFRKLSNASSFPSLESLTLPPPGFCLSVYISLPLYPQLLECWKAMDKRRRKEAKTCSCYSEEVSSIEWEFINMSEQEEDLIYRMYKLVGNRWALIAGRIPGRKAEEIERFWIMRHEEVYASKRRELKRRNS